MYLSPTGEEKKAVIERDTDNLTKDERARDKKLGYYKHFLSKHESCATKVVSIIWPKKMIVIKDKVEGAKEKKVAWYDKQGEWHVYRKTRGENNGRCHDSVVVPGRPGAGHGE